MRAYVPSLICCLATACLAQSPLEGRTRERLYVASRDVPLYVAHERAGNLPVRTVVQAEPAADTNWLRLRHQGRDYDAEASAFRYERDLLKDLADYQAGVRERYSNLVQTYDQLLERRKQLEAEAIRCEAPQDRMTVVIPPPAPRNLGQAATPTSDLVLVTRSPGPGRAAICRREMSKLDRQMEKLEQQLAGLELEGQRVADIRNSMERKFSDFRLAGQSP